MERSSPLRVLVADDHRDSADLIARLIEICGHSVRTVYNGLAALHVAGEFLPDVFVLDIDMPGLKGHEVAQTIRLRAEFKQAVYIACSALPLDDMVAEFFDHFLQKPAKFDQFEALLGSIASQRKPRADGPF